MSQSSVVRVLTAFAAVTVLPLGASAHILLSTPVARDTDDAVKSGPCGPYVKGAAQVDYTAGQQIQVQFRETIGHKGCYQVTLSTDNDATFTILNQVDDPDDAINPPRDLANPANSGSPRTVTATLPAGVTCDNCTIQLRQVMLETVAAFPNAQCGANQDIGQVPAGKVYFACADVNIKAAVVAPGDAGLPSSSSSSGAASSSGGATSSSGGAASTTSGAPARSSSGIPADGDEGSSGRVPIARDEGCNAAGGGAGSALLLAGVAFALVRRRKSR